MEVRQISVFLANEPGTLNKAASALKAASVNIRALSIMDATDFGLLRMIVNKTDDAVSALEAAHYAVNLNSVVVVDVQDTPGGLSDVLVLLEAEQVNIQYIYAFSGGATSGKALVIFKFDDNTKAIAVFNKHDIGMIDEAKIATL